MVDAPRYRFGPLERRGVLAGLRASQLGLIGCGGLIVIAIARSFAPPLAIPAMMTIAVLTAVAAFLPVGGQPLDEWVPVVGRWVLSGIRGRRFVSQRAVSGMRVGDALDEVCHLPPSLKGVSILTHAIPGSEATLGVIKDARAGTFTGILAARGKSFALLDGPDKARRLSNWAGILAGLAREGGEVHRVQWVERTVPDPGNEIGKYLKDNIAVPLDSLIARSYLEVVDEAGPVTQRHENFVVLQIHAGRAGRAIRSAGGGDRGACEVLRRELAALATQLVSAEITVDGALTPRLLAKVLRTAFDPSDRDQLERVAARLPEREGTSLANAGPAATESSWSTYRSDGSWHRTYWIAEWPRIDADADFLSPLLLRTESMRTVSVTMEPISPLKAIRSVESARTSITADEELRNRAGFMTTARRAREQEALASHERDLTDGHAFYRFAGFVTVSANDRDELDAASGEIEEAAGRSFIDLRRLNGQQDNAFTYTLPLGRGLR